MRQNRLEKLDQMTVETRNQRSADGDRCSPKGSDQLLDQTIHVTPGKIEDEDVLKAADAGKCGLRRRLNFIWRGGEVRSGQPTCAGRQRGGGLDDLFIRVGHRAQS